MLRILHFIGSLDIGGSQTFIMEIYRNIDRLKVQFDFVVSEGEKNIYADEVNVLGGKVFICPKFNGVNFFSFMNWWDNFFKWHQEYKVVHGHVRSTASIYIPIAHKYGCITIIHAHSTNEGKGIRMLVKRILEYPIRYTSDYFFSCSDAAGKWLYGKHIIYQEKYKVIANSINSNRFIFNSSIRASTREKLGLNDNLLIGHVGRFIKAKNHLFLLQIFVALKKQYKNAQLILIGDGPEKNHIQQQCYGMGIIDSVFFAGNRINTESFYMAMDIFVFPSVYEGLGLVLIEAQATGLPCIVSEAIQPEADLGVGLLTTMHLADSPKDWAVAILKATGQRRKENMSRYVKKAGFDSVETAKKLETFYLLLAEESR